jgi:hypothetical protein
MSVWGAMCFGDNGGFISSAREGWGLCWGHGDCLLISKAQSDNMEAITTQFLVIYPKRNTCGSSDFILFFCFFFFSYRSPPQFLLIYFFFYDPF